MNGLNVVEEEVEVAAAGGVADAVLYRPAAGLHPGVIHLPDGIGTRPSMRQMARRLAAEGYAVLLPNIYYRTARAPFFPPRPDFGEEATRARFAELTGALSQETMERDGSAYVDYLGSRKEVHDGPVGVVGYCFTGAFALRCAAARPDRVAAAASFHGGGLFKEGPSSPHLVLPRVKSRLYFGHARDDRGMPAAAIAGLEERWRRGVGVTRARHMARCTDGPSQTARHTTRRRPSARTRSWVRCLAGRCARMTREVRVAGPSPCCHARRLRLTPNRRLVTRCGLRESFARCRAASVRCRCPASRRTRSR